MLSALQQLYVRLAFTLKPELLGFILFTFFHFAENKQKIILV